MGIRTSDGKISAMATMRTYDDGCTRRRGIASLGRHLLRYDASWIL
jgi:hypothetical protein